MLQLQNALSCGKDQNVYEHNLEITGKAAHLVGS